MAMTRSIVTPTDAADLNDDLGRSDKREIILKDRLKEVAVTLNVGNSVGENHP